jgi:hypothetical protein
MIRINTEGNIMRLYIWYLILFGLFIFVAGLLGYADTPKLAYIWGYIITNVGMFAMGIRLERGHW